MNSWLLILLVVIPAALVTVSLMPVLIAVAARFGLEDPPHPRKMHDAPVPRVGGIGMMAGILVAGVAGLVTAVMLGQTIDDLMTRKLLVLLVAAVFIFTVGLVDDVRSVSSQFKMLAILAAGAALCGSGASIDLWHLGETGQFATGLAAWPITIAWVLAITTAIAFIDGLDGLASGLVTIAAGTLAALLLLAGETVIAVVPLALVGANLGFLVFNRHPAKAFMGDAGSLTLGFLVAGSAVIANPLIGTARGMLLPALALAIPLVDMALTMFRRKFVQRRSVFSSERGHIHHHLIDMGVRHPHAVVLIHLVSLAAVGIGVLAITAQGWATLGILTLAVPLIYGLFRFAGSLRTREMLSAIRRKRNHDRVSKRFHNAFEDMQLRFREVRSFSHWWQRVCEAAESFDLVALDLPVTGRDGSTRTLSWRPVEEIDETLERLTATVPIRQRRGDECLRARVEALTTGSLESAGHRIALFSRLMSEHSVADIRDQHQPAGRAGRKALPQIDGFEKINPATMRRPWVGPRPDADPAHPLDGLRIAVVHDFLYTYAGAERVLEQIIDLFPDCDIFSLFDFVPAEHRHFLRGKKPKTSILQRIPLAAKKHRALLPLMPFAIEQLDLSSYDIVISSSYTAAKGVLTGPDQLHICYCHSPVRYAWDLQHQYLERQNLRYSPKAMLARSILHYIRTWDARSSLGVDVYVANSDYIARRIEKTYRRKAVTIYPPVEVGRFRADADREEYYLTASRMVPYKRIDLIIEAFNRMPNRKLVVVGEGPDLRKLADQAGPNIEFTGYLPDKEFAHHLQRAKAFIFAAEEDFGIVPVEAMAAGTPVIAFGRGGVTESVIDGETGLFFPYQHPESILQAVERFEAQNEVEPFDRTAIRARAEVFDGEHFRRKFTELVVSSWQLFQSQRWGKAGNALAPSISPQRAPLSEHLPGAGGEERDMERDAALTDQVEINIEPAALPTNGKENDHPPQTKPNGTTPHGTATPAPGNTDPNPGSDPAPA